MIKGDIRLGSKLIEITGELSNTEPFQLTNVDSQFTTNWNTYMQGKDPASYFTISTTGYHVGLSSGEVSVLANTYTVTFNSNGGTGTMGNMTFTYDTAQALTKNAFTKTATPSPGGATGTTHILTSSRSKTSPPKTASPSPSPLSGKPMSTR